MVSAFGSTHVLGHLPEVANGAPNLLQDASGAPQPEDPLASTSRPEAREDQVRAWTHLHDLRLAVSPKATLADTFRLLDRVITAAESAADHCKDLRVQLEAAQEEGRLLQEAVAALSTIDPKTGAIAPSSSSRWLTYATDELRDTISRAHHIVTDRNKWFLRRIFPTQIR